MSLALTPTLNLTLQELRRRRSLHSPPRHVFVSKMCAATPLALTPTLTPPCRSYDAVAPFIHEYTYEALVYDLLQMDGNIYRCGARGCGGIGGMGGERGGGSIVR